MARWLLAEYCIINATSVPRMSAHHCTLISAGAVGEAAAAVVEEEEDNDVCMTLTALAD